MSLDVRIHFLTDDRDYEIAVDPSFTVLQFKELLRQQIPFFQRFSCIPTEVLKLSLEGFEEGLAGNVMEDSRPLTAYPLTEERHSVLLALERPVEKISCPSCQRPFVQWSSDRLCCGNENEEEDQEKLNARKDRIPQLLNCGHSVCFACWRDGLMAAEEAMAEEKEFLLTNPSLLTEEGVKEQNEMALQKAAENLWRKREREKGENTWKFKCPEEGCGVTTYSRNDQERSCHGGIQRLVHLKKREWVEAERARGRCFMKACGAEALFRCAECGDMSYCPDHFNRIHHFDDMSDHVPHLLLSSTNTSIPDIFQTRFCCYCGGGEAVFCGSGDGRHHCEHRDAGLASAREASKAHVTEQITKLGSLQADCKQRLIAWNDMMEQLQEHRVKDVERIRKEFDDLIARLEARKEELVIELRRIYRNKEMEIVQHLESLGTISGELEAGLRHHRQALATTAAEAAEGDACVIRDIVDINALEEMMSRLTVETSKELELPDIFIEFQGSEAQRLLEDCCQISAFDSNGVQPEQQKLSKHLEIENPVVAEQEVALSAACSPRTTEPNAETVDSNQTAASSSASCVNTTSTSTVPAQPKPSQAAPQRLPPLNQISLFEAAKKGSLEEVEYLVRNGIDLNCKDNENGNTSLHFSAEAGHWEVVQYLLQQGADIHSKDKNGNTPLHLSAYYGHWEVVKYLLQQGADIHCKNNYGWTPLHGSAYKGQLEVVKLLLQQGADKAIKKKDGRTPYDLIGMASGLSEDVKRTLTNLLKIER